jgi:hypothetical protein
MSDNMKLNPEVIRRAADDHTAAADYLRTVPESNARIMSCLESLGPVYAELREEGRTKLDERHASYHQQADDHEAAASGLHTVNARWESHENDAQERFRQLRERGL